MPVATKRSSRKKTPDKPKASGTMVGAAMATTGHPRTDKRLRVTTDAPGMAFYPGFSTIEPPPSADLDWRLSSLDEYTLDRATPERIMELLVDISPDINRAHFDWSRELNPGWDVEVTIPGTETRHEQGWQIVDGFMNTLRRLYGSTDVPLNRMHTGTFMRGAVFCELVIGRDRRTLIDLATPDPSIVRFRRATDPERGTIFEPGLPDAGAPDRWVSYDLPTIKYIPLDPMPGRPYGRPMISSALYTAVFALGMLHDLRRVISQQGYPRPDIEIILEELRQSMPGDIDADSIEAAKWVEDIVKQIAASYAALRPEDAYVHTSTVKLNRPMGTLDTNSLGSLGSLIEALERMMVRALKTAPFMMAVADGTTETQANRQWESHLQGVKAVQHLVESALEGVLEYALQINGIVADVTFRFAINRKGDELRDAMAEQTRIANEREKLAAGWTSQDEASQAITEHDAEEPEPRDGAWTDPLELAAAQKPAQPAPADNADATAGGEDPTNDQQDGEEDSGRMMTAIRAILDVTDEPGAIIERIQSVLRGDVTVDGKLENGHAETREEDLAAVS